MNFYSTNVDVNDRRIYTLELQEVLKYNNNKPHKSFVIDVEESGSFKILGLSGNDPIKSFVIGASDININSCSVTALLMDSQVKININADQLFTAFTPEPTPSESTIAVSDNEDIAFDDLDEFLDYEKTQKKPKKESPPQYIPEVKRQFTDLGKFNSYIDLRLEVNDFGIRLDGILSSKISQLPDEKDALEVKIILTTNNTDYEQTIRIALSHPSEFLGIALDFGSESSQMALNRYRATSPFSIENPESEQLFRNIYHYHKFQKWIDQNSNDEYYQEEPGTNFYKSLFFLKKKLVGDFGDIDKKSFIDYQSENLKMLVEKRDGFNELSKNFLQLPNLKILHEHEDILDTYHFETTNAEDYFPIDLKLRELKHQVYNSILETMIVSLLKKEFVKYKSSNRNIRMMLLVPNNYDTKNIHTIQEYLTQIFNNLKRRADFGQNIKTVEVLTISESDASFIGYMNKEGVQVRPDNDYIIIDSGKGTTDFSIIRTGSKNIHNLSSVYRNGFTGAGNMITYAIFETVIHYLRSVSPDDGTDISFIQNQLIQSLKDNDLASRNQFFNQLERLKFNYRDLSERDALYRNWSQASADATAGATRFANISSSGATIQTLSALLSSVSGITDFYGYVHQACDFITNSVISYLKLVKHHKKDLNLSGAILTGRAFRFKPLATMMQQKLRDELGINNIDLLQGNELKDICVRGVFNRDIKLNAENTGYPIQIIYKSEMDVPQEEDTSIKDKKNKPNIFQRAVGFLVNDLATLEDVSEIVTVKDEVAFNSLNNSEFLIGCKRYNIKKDELLEPSVANGTRASIDFTHDGFKMRRMKNGTLQAVSNLSEKNKSGNTNPALITPSLFPNYLNEDYIQSLQASINKISSNTQSTIIDDDLFVPSPSKPKTDDSLFF